MLIAIRAPLRICHHDVGQEHDGALIARVSERTADGKATAARLAAVAAAFGIGPDSALAWWQGHEAV